MNAADGVATSVAPSEILDGAATACAGESCAKPSDIATTAATDARFKILPERLGISDVALDPRSKRFWNFSIDYYSLK
jgi:hypothetical protein